MAARPDHPCHGVLLLDKPAGYSSTQALSRAKRLMGAAKAGHTGTLDPFATGLLPLVFGEATKFSRFLIDARKGYDAVLALGVETTTGDPEGEVVARREAAASAERVDAVLESFLGAQEQVPPMHSAVHVNGRRLYEYARAGEEVERPARRIEIVSLRRLSLRGPELAVSVVCSKGTYVRTLAMDIGKALGCGASLLALRRTSVGPFELARAITLQEVVHDPGRARASLLPPEVLVGGLPRVDATPDEALRFTRGLPIACASAAAGSEWALFAPGGRFLGVGVGQAGDRIAPLRLVAGGGAAGYA